MIGMRQQLPNPGGMSVSLVVTPTRLAAPDQQQNGKGDQHAVLLPNHAGEVGHGDGSHRQQGGSAHQPAAETGIARQGHPQAGAGHQPIHQQEAQHRKSAEQTEDLADAQVLLDNQGTRCHQR